MKEKNSHLRLSDGLFASSQAEEMRRMSETTRTTGRSKAKAQILSTEQLQFKERTKLFFENPENVIILLTSVHSKVQDGLINYNPGDLLNWAQQELGYTALDHTASKDGFVLLIYKRQN